MPINCLRLQGLIKLNNHIDQALLNHCVRCVSSDAVVHHGNMVDLHQDAEQLIEKAKAKLTTRKRRKPTTNVATQKLSEKSREIAVPSSRISRMVNYGSLAASLGLGAINESVKKQLGMASDNPNGRSALLTEANLEKVVTTLCKVRGAALKFGQMLSIQDNSLVPEDIQKIFERVRANADFMPHWQLNNMMVSELGENWRTKFKEFDERPFAAASIGQVHRGVTHDDVTVAVKIQYPGVAESINSDIDTLLSILVFSKLLPEGLFLEDAADVARRELTWEVDYLREALCSVKFKELLIDEEDYFVADYMPETTTKRIITTELMQGVPLDVVAAEMDQETKNSVAYRLLKLCLKELFQFNIMQTDPNWSNFLYNKDTDQICLLDFGATREFGISFVDTYITVINGAAVGDTDTVEKGLVKLGFLTGYETKDLVKATVDIVMILGEPFACKGTFDFGSQEITHKVQNLLHVMLKHRLTAPPEESYSLHRKMSGVFLIATNLKANINCYDLWQDIWGSYKFSQ